MDDLRRNQWTICAGISGRFGPEYPTAELHPKLAADAVAAARALEIPVTGLDFIVPAVDGPDYVIIEANERPGLANHEPQPTAQRFVDMLFPMTAAREIAS